MKYPWENTHLSCFLTLNCVKYSKIPVSRDGSPRAHRADPSVDLLFLLLPSTLDCGADPTQVHVHNDAEESLLGSALRFYAPSALRALLNFRSLCTR